MLGIRTPFLPQGSPPGRRFASPFELSLALATADPLLRTGQAHLSGVRLRGSAQLADVELVEGQERRLGRGRPRHDPPALAVKSIVVVNVALPFVSF
jgi:hypothetical protein